MREDMLSILRCPTCRHPLSLRDPKRDGEDVLGGLLACDEDHTFPIQGGIPNLIVPEELLPSDKEFLAQYQEQAEEYDEAAVFLFSMFFEDEAVSRSQLAGSLDLHPGDRVLEVSCGTGSNLRHIQERILPDGELYALDLSPAMMGVAMRKADGTLPAVRFSLANGAYLPFGDGAFDALLHVGGLNTFSEIRRALAEMTRVVRVGGKIVVSDEGLAPWLRETSYGATLLRMNALYEHQPPMSELPERAREVQLRWMMGGAFYVFEFRVGEAPRSLNMEATPPGSSKPLGELMKEETEGPGSGASR